MQRRKQPFLSVVVGSQLHGLANENSDTDVAHVAVSPLIEIVSPFSTARGKHAQNEKDEVEYELTHFVKLATQGNPTILEVLWSNKVLHESPHAERLREFRHRLLDSKRIYDAYLGYSTAQWRRIVNKEENDDRRIGKLACASLRILQQGIDLVTKGDFSPQPLLFRDLMLRAKQGLTYDEYVSDIHPTIVGQKMALTSAIKRYSREFTPDYEWIEEFLLDVYMDN